jgi:hypothetical protein
MGKYRCYDCDWSGDMPLIMGEHTTHWYGCPACKGQVYESPIDTGTHSSGDATVDKLMNTLGMKK